MTPRPSLAAPADTDRLALITKIARLYHEGGLRQPEIAAKLNISQSRISRILKEAVELGIVRTVVVSPPGVHTELEEAVRERFGLTDVVVAQPIGDDEMSILSALSGAAASYFTATLHRNDRVGISSWSSTLLAAVDKMAPRTVQSAGAVVQVLGGLGTARVQMKATHLIERMAAVTGASPIFFPAPGIVASETARDAILQDQSAQEVVKEWAKLTVLIAGIGSVAPSPLLKDSGNAVPPDVIEQLAAQGAVGDICLHFFDAAGTYLAGRSGERSVGIDVETLRRVPRRIGVAGGGRKFEAIRASILGGWIDVLITDTSTARALLDDQH